MFWLTGGKDLSLSQDHHGQCILFYVHIKVDGLWVLSIFLIWYIPDTQWPFPRAILQPAQRPCKPSRSLFVLHIEKTKDTYWIFVFPEKFKMDMSLLWTERKTVFNHDRKPIYFCTREINKTQFASMLFLLHLNYLIINEISWLLSSLASSSPSFFNSTLNFRTPSHGCSIL